MANFAPTLDLTKTPIELTVKLNTALAEQRTVHVDITVLSETVGLDALLPIVKLKDAERTWTLKSETADGTTLVYTASA
jgi:hypothetical protein